MKRILATLLVAALFLTACASTPNAEKKPDNTQPQLPALEGSVAITGDGKEDTQLTAEATLADTAAVPVYQWYLDGEALRDATGATFHVPVNAAGKSITVGVTAEGYSGEVKSEAVAAVANPADFKSMAGMYYASKVIGRVFMNATDATAAQIEWPASGFEFNIDAKGGNLKIHYETNYEATVSVFIDGQEQPRVTFVPIKAGYSCEFPVTAGIHNVKILRDGEPQTIANGYLKLKGVEFAGTVAERPADKELYIEVIGDSISSGIGTLGVYKPGGSHLAQDDSATHTYGFYVAQDLDADYSIVAKGGIGVVQGEGSSGINMMKAYEYTWKWSREEKYSFSRKPDLIILELGANDSLANDVTTALYKQEIQKFIQMLRQIHGEDVPILWLGRRQDNYHGQQLTAVQELIQETGDKNLYAVNFPCGSDGTGGVAGHPSAKNHRDFADQVTAYIKETIGLGK